MIRKSVVVLLLWAAMLAVGCDREKLPATAESLTEAWLEPDVPLASVSPEDGQTESETTAIPETTYLPETTAVPETTAAPVTTAAPETTAVPEPTAVPETTIAPETTAFPEITAPNLTSKGFEITVVNGVTYIDGVLIVNKTYSLPADYPQKSLTPEALSAYWTMRTDAAAIGLELRSISDYRSYYDQRYIYNGYVARDGQAAADRYSARAGHSEHQSGLAIDINSTAFDFDQTPEAAWLATHCVEYGFVIRYPKGKEPITGYMYEPWHIRYVGRELAEKLYLGNGEFTTLEEYFGITSAYAD